MASFFSNDAHVDKLRDAAQYTPLAEGYYDAKEKGPASGSVGDVERRQSSLAMRAIASPPFAKGELGGAIQGVTVNDNGVGTFTRTDRRPTGPSG